MNITHILVKFWQGKIKLWKSYWIVGELINALVIITIFNIELRFFNNTNLFHNFPLLSFNDMHFFNKFIVLIWTIFITIGIWRSAERYKGRIIWIIITLIVLSYRLFILKDFF